MRQTPDRFIVQRDGHGGKLRRAVSAVGLVGSALAIAWIVARRPEDFAVLGDIAPVAVIVIVGLQAVQLIATALMHRFAVAQATEVDVPLRPWAELFVVARFLNTVVPQSGNAYRATRLRQEWDVSLTGYIAAFLAFMWLLTEFNLLAALVIVLATQQGLEIARLDVALVLSVAAGIVGLGPILIRRLLVRLPGQDGRFGWLARRIDAMLRAATGSFATLRDMRRGVGYAALGSATAIAVTWTAFRALGAEVTLAEVVVFYAITQIGSFVPITPGNLGVQELAFGAVASAAGLALSDGILVSALLRATGVLALMLMVLPLGGIGVVRRVYRDRVETPLDGSPDADDHV